MKRLCLWIEEHAVFFDYMDEALFDSLREQGEIFQEDLDGTKHLRIKKNMQLIFPFIGGQNV